MEREGLNYQKGFIVLNTREYLPTLFKKLAWLAQYSPYVPYKNYIMLYSKT